MQKGEIRELECQALRLVQQAEMPVTVDYVARQLGVAWDTGRSLLLGLSCKGKLEKLDLRTHHNRGKRKE